MLEMLECGKHWIVLLGLARVPCRACHAAFPCLFKHGMHTELSQSKEQMVRTLRGMRGKLPEHAEQRFRALAKEAGTDLLTLAPLITEEQRTERRGQRLSPPSAHLLLQSCLSFFWSSAGVFKLTWCSEKEVRKGASCLQIAVLTIWSSPLKHKKNIYIYTHIHIHMHL